MNFDSRGHLKPYEIIEMSLENFELLFVNNEKRKTIFAEFQRYNTELLQLINVPFKQWIDGSFVTDKKNPNDIDLLTFIEHDIYNKHQKAIDTKFGKFGVQNYFQEIDAYTIWEYPKNHEYFTIFHSDYLYWETFFSNSKFNRAKKRFPKGFIQLTIN
jgi:hypothetical protein